MDEGASSPVYQGSDWPYALMPDLRNEYTCDWENCGTDLDQNLWIFTINEERFLSIIEKSNKRLESNPYVKLIDEQAKVIKRRQENSEFTLNYEDLIKEKAIENSETEKFKKLTEFTNTLTFYPTKMDLDKILNDSILVKKRKRWEETLSKDIYIDEAVNILSDLSKVSVNYKKIAQTSK